MLYQGNSLSVKEIEPGIAEVCFDQQGAPLNTLGSAAMRELSEAHAAA